MPTLSSQRRPRPLALKPPSAPPGGRGTTHLAESINPGGRMIQIRGTSRSMLDYAPPRLPLFPLGQRREENTQAAGVR
jgi:hypothetical protein